MQVLRFDFKYKNYNINQKAANSDIKEKLYNFNYYMINEIA